MITQQEQEPVLTKAITSLVLSCFSSALAQWSGGAPVDGNLAIEAVNFGISKTSPYSHFWWGGGC